MNSSPIICIREARLATLSPGLVISNSGTSSPFPDNEFTLATSFSRNPVTPPSGDNFHLENQISEVASLANSDNGSQNDDIVIGHRVSFELTAKEAKKPKLSILPEDCTIIDVDEYKAANDLPLPMFTKLTEVEIEEVEMEGRIADPIIDIDKL
ncbi:hypothetical protein IFM89_029068 [Coptis chinensis]|uniref:Uncharacterized protein n=1 Tax=Coptis chinensis TaxID=261450 RepID=A0A835IGV7_9MAGN|nr:hypothetical protein IFM89_029068 [Coptis chinensis]